MQHSQPDTLRVAQNKTVSFPSYVTRPSNQKTTTSLAIRSEQPTTHEWGFNASFVFGFLAALGIFLMVLDFYINRGGLRKRFGAMPAEEAPTSPANARADEPAENASAKPRGYFERAYFSGITVQANRDITLFEKPELDSLILTRYRRHSSYTLRCLGVEGDFFRVLFRKWQWFDPGIPTYDVAYVHSSECDMAQISESIFVEYPGWHKVISRGEAPEGLSTQDLRIYPGLYYVRLLDKEEAATIKIKKILDDDTPTPEEVITLAESDIISLPPRSRVYCENAELILRIDAAADDAALMKCDDNLPDDLTHMQRQDMRAGFIVAMVENY
jgi:hypothetical protein